MLMIDKLTIELDKNFPLFNHHQDYFNMKRGKNENKCQALVAKLDTLNMGGHLIHKMMAEEGPRFCNYNNKNR